MKKKWKLENIETGELYYYTEKYIRVSYFIVFLSGIMLGLVLKSFI